MHSLRPASRRPTLLAPTVLALTLLAAAWLPGQAHAQSSVTVLPTIVPGTPNGYFYTLTDLPTATDTVGEFDLAVPTTAALTSVGAPTGWLAFYTTGDLFIQWQSTASAFDIQPGAALSGFRFSSALAPGTETYKVQSFDTGNSATGTTLGPVAAPPIPEASTTVSLGLLLALGAVLRMGGVVVAGKRRKKA